MSKKIKLPKSTTNEARYDGETPEQWRYDNRIAIAFLIGTALGMIAGTLIHCK